MKATTPFGSRGNKVSRLFRSTRGFSRHDVVQVVRANIFLRVSPYNVAERLARDFFSFVLVWIISHFFLVIKSSNILSLPNVVKLGRADAYGGRLGTKHSVVRRKAYSLQSHNYFEEHPNPCCKPRPSINKDRKDTDALRHFSSPRSSRCSQVAHHQEEE
jgi:hypothetical protein